MQNKKPWHVTVQGPQFASSDGLPALGGGIICAKASMLLQVWISGSIHGFEVSVFVSPAQ